jgi:hypothetical protein
MLTFPLFYANYGAMSKKSGIYMKHSGGPGLIKIPAPVIVNQIVFCLHAFNIPYYQDNYKPFCYQIVLAAGRKWGGIPPTQSPYSPKSRLNNQSKQNKTIGG